MGGNRPQKENEMSPKRSVITYVLAYICWLISIVLGILILNLAREALVLSFVITTSPEATKSEQFYRSLQVAAASHWSFLIIGILAIVLLVGFEHYYRTGATTGILWKRFFMVTGIEALVLFLIQLVYTLMERTFQAATPLSIPILIVEALAAVLFFWLWSTRRNDMAHE